MKKIYDMTKGKIWTTILSFSLPLLGASLIQQLYNTADMIFVGNFVGKEATGAVGASSLLFTCIIGLFTGVSIGVGVAVSQKIGSKNLDIILLNIVIILSYCINKYNKLYLLNLIFNNKFTES